MYYSTTSYNPITIVKMTCPLCGKETNVKIERESTYTTLFLVINIWTSGKFIGTCFKPFSLDQDKVRAYLTQQNIAFEQSNWVKNILGCSPLLIIILLAYLKVI